MQLSADWVFAGTGYYRYDAGYTPELPGLHNFMGRVVHPQKWPEDLDYAGKRVVVIGSGATAVTVVPAMAEKAAHVTMLQRSPSYIMSLPRKDPIAIWLQQRFGAERGYELARRKNIILQTGLYQFCQRFPRAGPQADPLADRQAAAGGLSGRSPLQAALRPLGPAALLRPRRRPLPRDPRGQGLGGHRPHRDVHAEGGPACLRSGARRGHRRDRHRVATPGVRRGAHVHRRRAGRHHQEDRLPGDDARRRSQPGVPDRLHERFLDAEGRPGLRALLQVACVHGRAQVTTRAWSSCPTRTWRRARCSTSRPATCSAR